MHNYICFERGLALCIWLPGIVILMIDEKMSSQSAKDIVKGAPDAINSAFHLTYNMVLNLLRVEGINPEYMLERSFFQFQNYASIPQLYQRESPEMSTEESRTL